MDTNIFNLTYDISPSLFGGEKQKQNDVLGNGETMGNILEEYRLYLGVQYRKKNSQVRYQDSAKKFLRYVTDISEGEVQRYVIHLNRTHRPNTVTSEIVGLNRFFEYLGRKDLRVSTPRWRAVTRDTISRDDIIRIVEHAREHCRYMDYVILLMVRDCDCRNHEIVKTRWDWIHGDKILFQDCKTGDTTGRLTPDLKKALEHWRETTPYPDDPFVFTVQKGPFKGKPLAINGWYIRNLVNQVSIRVVGRRLNPQDLRASVITAEHTAFVNPKIIQLKARHRSEKTTQRYNHPSEQMVASYIESGTIFASDKEPVLKPKPEVREDKRGYINTLSSIPNLLENEDNTEFSFSYSSSFFVYDVSVTCLSDGVVGDGTRYSSLLATSSPVHLCFVSPYGLSSRAISTVEAWSVARGCDPLFCAMPPISSYWLSVTLFISGQQPFFGSPHGGCWCAGRWVTDLPWSSLAVPRSSFFEQESYVDKETSRVFCFSCFFSSLDLCPWSFSGVATVLKSESLSECGVTPSEQMKDVPSRLWCSNPGQVRALDLGGMVAEDFFCFPDLVIVLPPFLPMGGE